LLIVKFDEQNGEPCVEILFVSYADFEFFPIVTISNDMKSINGKSCQIARTAALWQPFSHTNPLFKFSQKRTLFFLFLKGSSSDESWDVDVDVPLHVQELVATDNSRFEDWVRQVKEFRVKSCKHVMLHSHKR